MITNTSVFLGMSTGIAILDNCTVCLVWLFRFAASILFVSENVAILFLPFNYVKKKSENEKHGKCFEYPGKFHSNKYNTLQIFKIPPIVVTHNK